MTDTDCDDTRANFSPDAEEVCDDEDNDCDGFIDESFFMKGFDCDVGLGECERTGIQVCNDTGGFGTKLVKDILSGGTGSNPSGAVEIGGTVFFAATDADGEELWKSDGTTLATVQVADIDPGAPGSAPTELTDFGGTLFFAATDATNGTELWKSNGYGMGTELVKDINPLTANSSPAGLTVIGGTLYFAADDGTNGRELWKTDGTAAGTTLVRDIEPGATGSDPTNLVAAGGVLYFSAEFLGDRELWKSDGTFAGTVRVRDINPGATGSDPANLTDLGGTLFFSADDGSNGRELWQSDGSPTGTALVDDINPGIGASSPAMLTVQGTTLFFTANDGSTGTELWKSDGTAGGTELVTDIRGGVPGSTPTNLTVLGSSLYFKANDGSTGSELWTSDGTAAGTELVKDILLGATGSGVNHITRAGDVLFFTADDGTTGTELWKTDGTAEGTVQVFDIRLGGSSSSPEDFLAVGDGVFFSAVVGSTGRELWKSDGTADGLVCDVEPGDAVTEICGNALDDDCDGDVDEFDASVIDTVADGTDQDCNGYDACYEDGDNDGYGSTTEIPGSGALECTDTGESTTADDCRDNNKWAFPGAAQIESATACMEDRDDDGYGDEFPPAGVIAGIDCDDSNATGGGVFPGATETPVDGIDQDCDGQELCYTDNDEDGFGTDPLVLNGDLSCTAAGVADNNTDCDDINNSVFDEDTDGDGFQDCNDTCPTNINGGNDDSECVLDPPGLTGWWPLDETVGTKAEDIAGDDDGTWTGTPVADPAGAVAGALSFDGVADYVELSSDYGFAKGDTFSVDAWINPAALGSGQTIMSQMSNTGFKRGWLFFVQGDGKLSFILRDNVTGLVEIRVASTGAIATGSWTHVAVTYDGSGIAAGAKLYIDGVLDSDTVNDGLTAGSSTEANLPASIGARRGFLPADVFFGGSIDEVEVFDRELDIAEIVEIRDHGKCKPGQGDDADNDLTRDACDGCPLDPEKTEPGFCGCGAEDIDFDGDGFYACVDDCNDNDDTIFPGAPEVVGDGIDQDCDAVPVDDCYVDDDEDGFGSATVATGTTLDCTGPKESTNDDDCDDTRDDTFPGAAENEVPAGQCMKDRDDDGWGDDTPPGSGTAVAGSDCKDDDATVNPDGTEATCNGLDDDCDVATEDAPDGDGDGYDVCDPGDPGTDDGLDADCADGDPAINPGAAEGVADGVDQNCNGAELCYADTDNDSYGSTTTAGGGPIDCIGTGFADNDDDCDDTRDDTFPGAAENEVPAGQCMKDKDDDGWADDTPPASGTAVPGLDCNDSVDTINPDGTEIVGNGTDEDCNGSDTISCFEDLDGDTYGSTTTVDAPDGSCDLADNESANSTDCDDSDGTVNPGATEVTCDNLDNDCNAGTVDAPDGDGDGYDVCDAADAGDTDGNAADCLDTNDQTFPGAAPNDSATACMQDLDGDDWGTDAPPAGVTAGTDCKDNRNDTFPGSAENETPSDQCMRDTDGDGWGDNTVSGTIVPGNDCDDADANSNPDGTEVVCTGADEDCDAATVDNPDLDGDGYDVCEPGDPGADDGNDADCDDTTGDTFPGAAPWDDGTACMKDTDDDQRGDSDPPAGVTAGSDCN
ncbi:MAG: hypothetical protein GY716_06625, partial [bacterium]|nr:hypothetical protein [bacterium]